MAHVFILDPVVLGVLASLLYGRATHAYLYISTMSIVTTLNEA
jgi:hypothetical protein